MGFAAHDCLTVASEAISPASVAFAIDTFHFGGEPVSPSLQI